MSYARFVIARWLQLVSLALWLGGLVAIGALVAPVTAHFIHSHPVLAVHPGGKTALLTAIVGGSLRAFNPLCFACGALLLLAQALLWPVSARRLSLVGIILTLALLGSVVYQGLSLFPAMDAAQAAGRLPLFDALHRRYEAISLYLQLPLLLSLALVAALRDTPRRAARS